MVLARILLEVNFNVIRLPGLQGDELGLLNG
jgi:hypothetical protein